MVGEVRNGVVGLPHDPLLEDPLPDQQQGRPAHECAEPPGPEAQEGHRLLDQIQGQYGHHAVEQGDVRVRDGGGGQVRHGHGDDQVEGLQIGDLPLARHTQDEEDEDVQEHRPEKQYQHRNSMTEKYIPDS